jgi:S1-C subfamily serine protease
MGRLLTLGTHAATGLLIAGMASAQGVDPVPPEQLFERLAPSVWTVETYDSDRKPVGLGSAVVVGPGSLVTNCHVLAKASRVIVARENVSYGATLEHPDPERDLCMLKVRNFTAPPVTIGNVDDLKVGARVYAIGSPRGLEQTISDGLLSGVRRSSSGDFAALQITVPISPGSSGGGLFDAYGRLVGITTFGFKESQNLNFALPASWIAEIPQRATEALAARAASRQAGRADGGGFTASASRGQVFEYELRDRLSGSVRTVTYRLERIDGDRLLFNQGSRVEKPGGGVVSLTAAIGGEFDVAMPPGGWLAEEPKPGSTWKLSYQNRPQGNVVSMDLEARAFGESRMRFKTGDLRVIRVEFTGYTNRAAAFQLNNPGGRYTAAVWYAPELGRIVRFEASTRGGSGSAAFYVDEQLQLVDIRNEIY